MGEADSVRKPLQVSHAGKAQRSYYHGLGARKSVRVHKFRCSQPNMCMHKTGAATTSSYQWSFITSWIVEEAAGPLEKARVVEEVVAAQEVDALQLRRKRCLLKRLLSRRRHLLRKRIWLHRWLSSFEACKFTVGEGRGGGVEKLVSRSSSVVDKEGGTGGWWGRNSSFGAGSHNRRRPRRWTKKVKEINLGYLSRGAWFSWVEVFFLWNKHIQHGSETTRRGQSRCEYVSEPIFWICCFSNYLLNLCGDFAKKEQRWGGSENKYRDEQKNIREMLLYLVEVRELLNSLSEFLPWVAPMSV